MYYIGQMVLDQGVSINEVLNQENYIILRGVAPDQRTAYLLAEKLFHSRMQKEFNFKDIVPFWKKNQFTFILKKPTDKNKQNNIEIKSPMVRGHLEEKFLLEGICSQEGVEIIFSGDFQGKTICKRGSWAVELSTQKIDLPILGVEVSQGFGGQVSKDYRSFLKRKP